MKKEQIHLYNKNKILNLCDFKFKTYNYEKNLSNLSLAFCCKF